MLTEPLRLWGRVCILVLVDFTDEHWEYVILQKQTDYGSCEPISLKTGWEPCVKIVNKNDPYLQGSFFIDTYFPNYIISYIANQVHS